MAIVEDAGFVRDEAGAPVDRIEGGTLGRVQRDYRGIPPTTVLVGAVVVVLFGLFLGWYLFHSRTLVPRVAAQSTPGTATSMPQRDAITQEQARQALLGPPPVGGPVVPGQVTPSAAVAGGPQQLPVGMAPGQTQPGTPPPSGATPQQRPLSPRAQLDLASRRAPIMGFAGGMHAFAQPGGGLSAPEGADPSLTSPAAAGGSNDGARPVQQAGPTAGAAQDGLSSQLGHHVIETARATVVPNRAFLLSAGTLVPCTLQTAINSTQAGYVSCVIGHDVYSEDGRVVLLDKGTKVLGQYSGGIAQGQARLFVLWTRALTPRGVAIDLGSPAADDLGRAGMAGGVDTMFWQRFGGALMLSVLEDLGNIASSHFANGGTQTTQVPADTASTALQSTINIRPILKKNQGDQVAIFVAKDFDFSSVYDVHVKR